MRRHKIPVHLETPDTFLLGMTARQVLVLGLGLTLAYIVVSGGGWSLAMLALTLPVALVIAVASLIVAFVAPRKRHMETWSLVVLNYLAIPKCYVWRPLAAEAFKPVKSVSRRKEEEDED